MILADMDPKSLEFAWGIAIIVGTLAAWAWVRWIGRE